MKISLEYYKVLYYVSKCGSITLAAERLCITQPAVSQAIYQLEQEFGCKLFVRSRKGVSLTKEGSLLMNYVKPAFEMMELGENKLKKMLYMELGEIRIGASDMTLQFFLLPFLEQFHDTYPNIKIHVTNGPTPETIRYLLEGKIDFGIVTSPFENRKDITVIPVKQIQDIFVAGHDFKHLKDKKMDFHELNNLPLICLEKSTSTRRFMDEILAKNNIIMEPEFELATSDMIVQFACRNLGVGCVVSDFASQYLESGELFKLEFKESIPSRDMCIITDSHNPVSVAGKKLLDILKGNEV